MPRDNLIVPFQLDRSLLRGRMVRLGGVLNDILAAHEYPHPIAHMVAETVCLSVLLSSMLKYDGIFTLQMRGDGPVSLIVADVTSGGDVRACAHFDEERMDVSREALEALRAPEGSSNHLAQYLGQGYIAFTVDQAGAEERYQGIVELKGASLVECVQHYFTQSEQIGTGIKMAVGLRDGAWRAGGVMLQNMPENDGRGGDDDAPSNVEEDDWRRAMIFMDSCTEDELLSPELSAKDLLFRLFHEEEVRVFDATKMQKKCRCSVERVQNVVKTLPDEDREHLIKDGRIEVNCEFCSTEFLLDAETLESV